LFGNIAINQNRSQFDLCRLLNCNPKPSERRLVFPFNQDHLWQPIAFLRRIRTALRNEKIPLRLLQIGRIHADYGHWNLIRDFSAEAGWECNILGPRDEHTVSSVLQECHVGISASQIQIARKSGAVLAMLEHGLPVICSQSSILKDWAGYSDEQLTSYEVHEDLLRDTLLYTDKFPAGSFLESTTTKWLNNLKGESDHGAE
jgi:hypothetical protein